VQHPPNHFFDHTPDSLAAWCASRGMAKFRPTQILDWVYRKGMADPAKMTNLSPADRATLKAEMTFLSGNPIAHQLATDGTQKLLIEWLPSPSSPSSSESSATSLSAPSAFNSEPSSSLPLLNIRPSSPQSVLPQTECVMIPTESRKTACISSQVGCPVGCKFCASGLGGLEGNLTAGRIVEQVWRLQWQALGTGHQATGKAGAPDANGLPSAQCPMPNASPRITNVVFMGMGEPLANFAAVVKAVRTLAAPWGMGISARKITISTVGLPKAIERLAAELDLPVTLALSLHAPTDELRRQLIPWAEYTTIEELLAACSKWFQKTGREITLEYTLLREVNDRPEHAAELARIARSLRANINLIRYNEVAGMPFKRPLTDDVLAFQAILREAGHNAHIRKSRGRDIAAACGQLRHERQTA
jgi:23S rRNA (adenine2503-C2)-methyltransferase